MRRIFLFTSALLLLISISALGQSLNTGIIIGLNSATVGGQFTNGLNIQSITTSNYGLFAQFDLFDLVALQTELLYSMKGYRHIYQVEGDLHPGVTGTSTGNIAYLEIPILLKMNVPSSSFGIFKPNVFAGPEVAFKLVNGNSKRLDLPITYPNDFGIIVGLGTDIALPITTMMVDVRYDFSIRTLASQNQTDVKNRVISLNAGIGI